MWHARRSAPSASGCSRTRRCRRGARAGRAQRAVAPASCLARSSIRAPPHLPDSRASHLLQFVLIGDAAHALLPMTGQGANSAIDDAVCLAIRLSKARKFSETNCFICPLLPFVLPRVRHHNLVYNARLITSVTCRRARCLGDLRLHGCVFLLACRLARMTSLTCLQRCGRSRGGGAHRRTL